MKVTFDNVYNAFQIIAPKGTMISFTGEPTALADGVYLVGDDGIINLDEQFLTDTLYLSTEGTDYAVTGGMRVTYPLGDETVIIRAGSSTIPFSKGGKGGGGSSGDNTHYKGTTTTPISNGSTTNPITIDGESYTAVFGDIVVYGYTEFVFDGTTWSEFGRPFDTTPTSGSANAVTSDGIASLIKKGTGINSSVINNTVSNVASANNSLAVNTGTVASASGSFAAGNMTTASQPNMMAIGKYNSPRSNDLFNIGNGTSTSNRSNIVEVNSTEFNVNGDITKNGVSLPTPYTTMPTITASMLGQIAQYVGETTNDYVKGYFYIASSDGAAEPTYSWVSMVDSTPTSGSKNFVSSDGVYTNTAGKKYYSNDTLKGEIFNNYTNNKASGNYSHAEGFSTIASGQSSHAEGYIDTASGDYSHAEGARTTASGRYSHAEGYFTTASGENSHASGSYTNASQHSMTAIGKYNSPNNGDLFNIGNGTSGNARSNILEANSTSVNINGDIQRDGVGIDDYTTTERKIGKWIDGSDLYQRTFEVTGLSKNTWNNSILDTSDIKIVDFTGLIYWLDNQAASDSTPLNYYASDSDNCFTCINTAQTDMRIYPTNTSSDMSIDKAIITIKYTKPSAQANLMQTAPTEEVLSETPTVEEDDMR